MKWTINYSREAEKFIEREDIRGDVREELTKFLKKMKGEDINIVKKLKGPWEGYCRIRKGKLRIIFDVDYKLRSLFYSKQTQLKESSNG